MVVSVEFSVYKIRYNNYRRMSFSLSESTGIDVDLTAWRASATLSQTSSRFQRAASPQKVNRGEGRTTGNGQSGKGGEENGEMTGNDVSEGGG